MSVVNPVAAGVMLEQLCVCTDSVSATKYLYKNSACLVVNQGQCCSRGDVVDEGRLGVGLRVPLLRGDLQEKTRASKRRR
jgi:hypothetical protein